MHTTMQCTYAAMQAFTCVMHAPCVMHALPCTSCAGVCGCGRVCVLVCWWGLVATLLSRAKARARVLRSHTHPAATKWDTRARHTRVLTHWRTTPDHGAPGRRSSLAPQIASTAAEIKASRHGFRWHARGVGTWSGWMVTQAGEVIRAFVAALVALRRS